MWCWVMVRKNIIYEHKHLEMIVSETIHIKKKKKALEKLQTL